MTKNLITEPALQNLVSVLGGEAELITMRPYLAEDVRCHFDNNQSEGFAIWYTWLQFLKIRGRAENLRAIHTHTIIHEDETVTLGGHWLGTIKGVEKQSKYIAVRYRVENGMIQEIWTTRANYVFPLGQVMNSPYLWVLPVIHCTIWKKFSPVALPAMLDTTTA